MKQELTQINLDLKEHLLLLLPVENQNKLWSSLQTPTEPVPSADTTFVTQAEGFTPLSPA